MDTDIKHARQALDRLPSSPEKSEALRLLKKIEEAEPQEKAEDKVFLENIERIIEKCRLTKNEERFFRWLPLFSAALGCIASYDGLTAIWTKEFCHYSQGISVCTSGQFAQIKGGAALIVGVCLFLLAFPNGRWRTISLLSMGFLLFSLLLGGSFLV